MSFFDKSRNFLISGGQFTSITTKTDTRKKGIDLLYEHTAPGAFHNSAERYDPPKCHPNTRVAVIQAIIDWVEDGQKTTLIKWMYGAAGAGKSAIAQEVAERYHQSGHLAASFFWSRSAAGRNDEKHLIPSLAYQLLISIPQIRDHVEEAVESDPSIFARSIEAQMESLIVRPLERVFGHGQEIPVNPELPQLIILDGLDECGTPQAQQYILKVVAGSLHKFATPLFFLIASRPEQTIRASFHINPLLNITAKLALNEKYRPDDDIRLFLVESFESVKSTHQLRSLLPHVWPTKYNIDHLVCKSSGQFIYAATVVKFVRTSRRMPSMQLEIILGITVTEDTPFAELDALYHHIFSSVEDSPRALELLACLFLSRNLYGYDVYAPERIQTILSYGPGQLQLILSDLHSVMEVPDVGDECDGNLRVLHASLQDFLMDPTRSRNFCIDKCKAHARIARHSLRYIKSYSPNTSDTKFNPLSCLLFDELGYHCRHSSPTKELLENFFDFDFLKWASCIVESIPDNLELYMLDYFTITRLYSWLQTQEANVQGYFGLERSLSIRHSHSWGVAVDLLCKKFCDGLSTNKDIITSLITHPQICYHYSKAAVRRFFQALDCKTLYDCLYDLKDDCEPEEPVELQKYLCDPERAGKCFVHGETYATLSAEIFKFILFEWEYWQSDSEGGEGTHEDISDHYNSLSFAIRTLPFYISNADYEPELARRASNILNLKFRTRHLCEAPEVDSEPGMKELHQAIDLYLKKRPPTPGAESRKQKKKHHMHGSSEESLEATNLAMTHSASPPLIPPPRKRLRLMDLLNPDTGS